MCEIADLFRGNIDFYIGLEPAGDLNGVLHNRSYVEKAFSE